MDDPQLLKELLSVFQGQLENQKSSAPVSRYDRVQDELNGWLSDIEFQDKPSNLALLYFMYGMIKPLEHSPSKEFTVQYLQQIVDALRLAEKGARGETVVSDDSA